MAKTPCGSTDCWAEHPPAQLQRMPEPGNSSRLQDSPLRTTTAAQRGHNHIRPCLNETLKYTAMQALRGRLHSLSQGCCRPQRPPVLLNTLARPQQTVQRDWNELRDELCTFSPVRKSVSVQFLKDTRSSSTDVCASASDCKWSPNCENN